GGPCDNYKGTNTQSPGYCTLPRGLFGIRSVSDEVSIGDLKCDDFDASLSHSCMSVSNLIFKNSPRIAIGIGEKTKGILLDRITGDTNAYGTVFIGGGSAVPPDPNCTDPLDPSCPDSVNPNPYD